jgi:hypothetical protein
MRSRIFAMLLCLALLTSGASAMGMPSTGDRGPAGLVDLVWTFVQNLVGMKIDPWGEPANTGAHPGGTDGSDLGPKIDPWGDEGNTARPDDPAGSDLGPQIDPWG